MPLSREKMAEYQRARRAKAPARAKSAPGVKMMLDHETAATIRRTIEVPIAMEAVPGHVHTWTRADDDCICEGCDTIVPWKGKLLARYTDGLPEWPQLIQAMPTKEIERMLNRINTKRVRG